MCSLAYLFLNKLCGNFCAMSVHEFIQSRKRINYHDDIILRTPFISIRERMLIFSFKGPWNNVDRILEFEHPKCKKEFQVIMRDLC